jgi:hypothetical protein
LADWHKTEMKLCVGKPDVKPVLIDDARLGVLHID